jgi:cyanophycinase
MNMRSLLGVIAGALASTILGCSSNDGVPQSADAPNDSHVSIAQQALATPNAAIAHGVGKKLMIIGNMTDELVGTVTDDAIFIDRIAADVGGAKQLKVLVVPGASSSPNWLYSYFRSVMPTRGVPVGNVTLAHIAGYDDSSTPDVDESTWANGAYKPSEVAKIAAANVVWFDGGDQSFLVNLMLDAKGHDSPFQAAIKAKLAANNLIIAGYSAGAAVMSDPMIGAGSSWGALTQTPDLSTPPGSAANPCDGGDELCVTRGLGYIPAQYSAMIDQHFTQRGRFARTVRALAATNQKNGWGVSEFSGFYIDFAKKQAEVVGVPGKAFVGLVGRDSAFQNREQNGLPFLGENYTMSILAVGDTYTLPDAQNPHGVGAHPIAGDYYAPFSEYYSDNPVFTDAFGYQVLVNNVSAYFADGTPQTSGARVDAIALKVDETGPGSGFRFRFTADDQSQVAWNEDSGYSMFNARWKISTIKAQFTGLGP